MVRTILLACFLAVAAARSVQQSEDFTLDRDAEFVPRSEIEAVNVPAASSSDNDESEDGRQFPGGLFPRVRIFRFPPLFRRTSPPLFPDFFYPAARRPTVTTSTQDERVDDLFPDLFGDSSVEEGADESSSTDPKTAAGEDAASGVEKGDKVPDVAVVEGSSKNKPPRRTGFPSLADVFSDMNRRMQAFEDEISSLFRTFVRVPERSGEREPAASDSGSSSSGLFPEFDNPSTGDEEGQDTTTSVDRPGFGFGLFRPFRPFGTGIFGFRNPSDFPTTYKNTTSKTEVVNGTRVMINETIHKGGDENSSHFFHVKVIHMAPEDGEDQGLVTEQTSPTTGPRDVEEMTEKPKEFVYPEGDDRDDGTEEFYMPLPNSEINEVESRSSGSDGITLSSSRDADVGVSDDDAEEPYFMDAPDRPAPENRPPRRSVSILGSDLDVNRARYLDAKRRGMFEPNPDAQLFGRRPEYVPTQLLERGPYLQ